MVDPIKTYYLRTKPPTPSRRCTGPKFVAERWVEPGHIVCLVALPHSMPGAPRLYTESGSVSLSFAFIARNTLVCHVCMCECLYGSECVRHVGHCSDNPNAYYV